MKAILLLNLLPDLIISRFALRRSHIHLIHFDLHTDVRLCLRKFGQKTYRLDVDRVCKQIVDITRTILLFFAK